MRRISAKNQAVSTVIGTILFLILIVSMASVLFLTIYRYNDSVKQALLTEDTRSQEKIAMTSLKFDNETTKDMTNINITGITIQNLGSITSQIRALYIDNNFTCDPSNPALNSDGAYVNAHESKLVNLPPTRFNASSFITVATSRGIKAIELESNFLNTSSTGYTPVLTNYGPLRLNFSLFYYRATDKNGMPTGPWQPGSNISSAVNYCAWNITVTNIDTRDITLSQYCSLTLVTNEGGSQFPWYTDNPNQLIPSNQTVQIVYIWAGPLPTTSAGGFTGFSGETSKVFLTFFGKFSDGATYGQTIPFEGILRR